MIAIIDYGMGNVGSIRNMLAYLGYESTITANAREAATADRLILPGVGTFDRGIEQLRNLGIDGWLGELVCQRKKPLLGICLGMQLLGTRSEEGQLPGLGWIKAETVRFRFPQEQLKVPHIGWSDVVVRDCSTLLSPGRRRFYFVHSFHLQCDSRVVTGYCTYGYEFAAMIESGNIFATQFHPEKSHKFGLELLQRFASAEV